MLALLPVSGHAAGSSWSSRNNEEGYSHVRPASLPQGNAVEAAARETPLVADSIRITKHERNLTLYYKGEPVKSYHIRAFGADPVGHKTREGDEKTPEGLYYIQDKRVSQKFQKFMHISYPNEADKAQAAARGVSPGGFVGIHGDRGGWSGFVSRFQPSWTDGCIAVANDDLEEIYAAVDAGTPIYIEP